jgi:imidazolonepropionase
LKKAAKSRVKESVDLLILNGEELLTLTSGSSKPRTGSQMRELGIIHDGALAVQEGRVIATGKTPEIAKVFKSENVINARGKTVLPGFVDPHTHLVFAGSCEEEFEARLESMSSTEVQSCVSVIEAIKETRKARLEKLVDIGLDRLDAMLAHGTTTVEAKSGYGLTTEAELRILEATKRLNQLHSVNVISTFLGAHAVPPEYRGNPSEYVALVVGEMIPAVVERELAEFCDVSCERDTFNFEQARYVLETGKKHGLKPKIHADKLSMLGGAEIAADVGAVSAEHLLFSSVEGIKAMAEKGVVAVLLPAAAFSMNTKRYPNARLMIESGLPVALGTDCSPRCWVENQQLVVAMACHCMGMTPAEAITAVTINAAHAVNRAGEVGSLEVGKKADIMVLNVPSHNFLGYRYGVNMVDKVVKNGRLVVDREKQDEPVFRSETE